MKKMLILAGVVFAAGYLLVIAAELAGLISLDVFTLPVLLGCASVSAVVGFVFSDYARKPRFRVRQTRAPGTIVLPSTNDAAANWTYTTKMK